MEKILSDFGVQPILLLAQIVNFLILLILLKKFLYKPILQVLEKRKETIDEATKQAAGIIAEAHLKAQTDIEEMLKKGQEAITLEREKMQSELKGEVADLVGKSVAKVLEGLLDKQTQKKISDQAIKNL